VLNQLKTGDPDALTTVFNRYWEKLFISAYNILKDKAAAEDIVQDIFLSLWIKRETLEIKSSLEAYLQRSVRYQVFHFIKDRNVRDTVFKNIEERIWKQTITENSIYQKELQQRMNIIVDQLPDKCRQIYQLSREQNLSHKEIAERLDITTKTVENQITIAIRRIRASLGELLPLIALFLGGK
ncbi:MAG: RNA polymerase sigma-70 factor, partial [Chitinophagaceae bacterium]|nr:RNA polymerase sigma-70 factor [Chitinophagaceae bacterium]